MLFPTGLHDALTDWSAIMLSQSFTSSTKRAVFVLVVVVNNNGDGEDKSGGDRW